MQPGDTVQAFRQAPAHQPTALLVHDLDIVVVFPVVTHERHLFNSLPNADHPSDSAGGDGRQSHCPVLTQRYRGTSFQRWLISSRPMGARLPPTCARGWLCTVRNLAS